MLAGFYQFSPVFGEREKNIEKAVSALRSQTADLMVLPELFSSGYQFTSIEEVMALSEEIPAGPATEALIQVSKERKMYIVAGLAERSADRFFNSAVLTGPEGFIGVYRKTHLFYEEKLWFSPGDTGFMVWQTPVGKIGIMVCFDWFFPESVRTLALKGAEVIAHPANLVLPYCPDGMVTRCIENRVFAITANRTGIEMRGGRKELRFIGTSEIVSPGGRILFRAGADSDVCGIADINVREAENKDLNEYNNLFGDRRPEYYS